MGLCPSLPVGKIFLKCAEIQCDGIVINKVIPSCVHDCMKVKSLKMSGP